MDESLPIYLFHRGTNYEAYRLFCPRPVVEDGEEGWVFHCWAPNAKSVAVIGDFNGWNAEAHPMEKISVGVWRAFVAGANEWQNYRFLICGADGKYVEKTDPYATHCETPPANAGKLCRIDGYEWQDGDWMRKRGKKDHFNRPMNVYEMHLGSWRRYPDNQYFDYRKIADELIPYLLEMNYTHVEFMPLTEHPFDGSWGYQCTGMFAPTSRYGSPKDLMYLVDRLHQAGIGVFMDWVPAHFPKDSFGLYRFDGDFLYEYHDENRREHPQWGTVVYDYGRNEVRSFLISSASFWFDYYHIDGIRMDAVSSMLYLDFGRDAGHWTPNVHGGNINLEAENFLKELNNAIHGRFPGALMIAEESSSYPNITASPDIGGLGFDYKWNMGWMNDTLRYVACDPLWRKEVHNNMTFGMMYAFKEHYVLALSHDEVVHGKGSLINKQPGYYIDKFGGLMTYLGYQMAHPGKKLNFMGVELGQFAEWDYRKGLDWNLLEYDTHRGVHAFVRDLNALYIKEKALWEQDCTYDGFTWLVVNEANWNIYAWQRTAKNGDAIVAVMNFSPMYREGYWIGVPQPGKYSRVLTSADRAYGVGIAGGPLVLCAEEGEVNGFPYHISVDILPNSVSFFKFKKSTRRTKNEAKE